MKKNSMHNLGEELELQEFMNNNSTHEFSQEYINKKNELLKSVGYNEKVKKIRKRNFVAAAAVGFTIIALPGSVFATKQIMSGYGIATKQTGNYEYEVAFSNPTQENGSELGASDTNYTTDSNNTMVSKNDPLLFHTFVKMDINYMPDGYVQSVKDGFKYAYNGSYDSNLNVTIGLNTIIENQVITKNNTTDVKAVTVNGREATIFYKNAIDETTFNKDMIVYFNEYGYVVEIYAQVGVSEDELMKIAENITLTPCEEDVATSAGVYPTTSTNKDADKAQDTSTKSLPKLLDNDNFFTFGEAFKLPELTLYSNNEIDYTIENYEILDSVSGLDMNNFGDELSTVNKLIDENGNFTGYTHLNIEQGDRINSVDTVTGSEHRDVKMVYVTIKLKNNSNHDINEFKIAPQICCLNEDNSTNLYYASEKAQPEGWDIYCDYKTMYDENPDLYSNKQRYGQRYSIGANEERTFHVGYIVDADKTDNMVLFYNPTGQLSTNQFNKTPAVIKLNK